MKRAVFLPIAVATVACSPVEGVQAGSCIGEVEQMFADRAAFVEKSLQELDIEVAPNEDRRAPLTWDAEDFENGKEADIAEANRQLQGAMQDISQEDTMAMMEFMSGLEQRENRIRLAIRECPEAATLTVDEDRTIPFRVKVP